MRYPDVMRVRPKLGWVVITRTVRDMDVEYRAPQDVLERVLIITTHPSALTYHKTGDFRDSTLMVRN